MPEPTTIDPLPLAGRAALVTGGSRGLGRAIALALGAAGADVMVTSRTESACEEVAGEIRKLGRRAYAYGCHVGRWAELDGLVDAAYDQLGRVDILVNNAGKSPTYGHITDINEAMFDSVIGLNLKGPFRLAALVGTRMAAGDGGSIINISSVLAQQPTPETLPYAAAKAGLNAMTIGLSRALGPNVRVNSVLPGAFATDVSLHWSPQMRQDLADAAALRRIGEPDEICGAVLYLAGSSASFTTGSLLRVDGGTT
jgi:NAD(P)-dependent dehydrogenase (short-subunit alcohol dehydrogenase family)